MPKRPRKDILDDTQQDLSDVEIDDLGHTPKWTRSSPSESPEPVMTPESSSMASTTSAVATKDMQCLLPGHQPLGFASLTEFEVHYAKEHTNKCVECQANLPSEWLLDLHHKENHDPLIAGRRETGEKTYECFLKDCNKRCLTPQKRRLHLIDKHGYPRNYDFRIVDTGSRGKTSLLRESGKPKTSGRRRRVSDVGTAGWRDKAAVDSKSSTSAKALETHQQETTASHVLGSSKLMVVPEAASQEVEDPQRITDNAVDSLTSSMSALQFVPMSVRTKTKKKP